MSKKNIIGIFDDDDAVLKAIPALHAKGISIKDVISPYPIHGLDVALGLKRTRIAICCFLYGVTGCALALTMIWYMMIHDWPMDIGGKPNFTFAKNLLAFIPVTFESTVLCAAHGMVITFYLRSKLFPGVEPWVPDTRMTDDKIIMHIIADEAEVAGINQALLSNGASEVK